MPSLRIRALWLLPLLLLVFIGAHLPYLNQPLKGNHIARQIEAHTLARNYAQHDPNLFHPDLNDMERPKDQLLHDLPLHGWATGMMHRMLGPEIWVARLTSLLWALLAITGMYALVRNALHHEAAAACTAWAFAWSPDFYYHAITPTQDTFLLMLVFWAIALLLKWREAQRAWQIGLSMALFSLAALCQTNHLIFFLFPMGLWIAQAIRERQDKEKHLVRATLYAMPATIPLFWKVTFPELIQHPIDSFADWFGAMGHHLGITLPEQLINYASMPLFLAGIFFLVKGRKWKHADFIAFLLLGVALLAHLLLRMTYLGKQNGYMLFLLYPLLFLLVGMGIKGMLNLPRKVWTWVTMGLLLLSAPLAMLRMNGRWTTQKLGYNPDLLAHQQELVSIGPKDAKWVAGNDPSHCAFLYFADHQGISFTGDMLDPLAVQDLLGDASGYLLSDSRVVEENPKIKPFLRRMVLEAGSLRVFEISKPVGR